MKGKDEQVKCFKLFHALFTTHFGMKIQPFKCDNGGEFSSKQFKDFCSQKGILIQYSTPYTPQQNGLAERKNRTLVEKARTMLNSSKLDKVYCGDALLTATHLHNRSPISANEGLKTPIEVVSGKVIWLVD